MSKAVSVRRQSFLEIRAFLLTEALVHASIDENQLAKGPKQRQYAEEGILFVEMLGKWNLLCLSYNERT